MLLGVAALTDREWVCRGVSHDIRVDDQLLKASHIQISVDGGVMGGRGLGGGWGNGGGGCRRLLGLLDWTKLPGHLLAATDTMALSSLHKLQALVIPNGRQELT